MDSKPEICSSRFQLIRISGLSLKFQIITDNTLILLGKIWLKRRQLGTRADLPNREDMMTLGLGWEGGSSWAKQSGIERNLQRS